MHVSVLSWSAYGGGRARALLSLVDHLSAQDIGVSLCIGSKSWGKQELIDHHAIEPDIDWDFRDLEENTVPTIKAHIKEANPDVVISWDQILNTKCRGLSVPTVGYCRTNYATGLDDYWCPSRQTASKLSHETRQREQKTVKPIYPAWYIQKQAGTDRPIDIMIHGRKANGVISKLNPDYNIVLANSFTYPELKQLYKKTKLFLFPKPDRFEPLGLMPIEAAAHGCQIAIPENSGVAEIYPSCAYDKPTENVAVALENTQSLRVPTSPTDVVERLKGLVH